MKILSCHFVKNDIRVIEKAKFIDMTILIYFVISNLWKAYISIYFRSKILFYDKF